MIQKLLIMPDVLDAPPSVDIVPDSSGPSALPPPSSQPSAPSDTRPSDMAKPFHNAFEDLDKMLEAKETPKLTLKKALARKPQDQSKEAPKEPQEPEAKDSNETPLKSKSDDIQNRQPKELRTAYEALKAKTKTLETELAHLRAEKSKPPSEDPEKKTLSERVQQYERRLKELDEELKYAAYERSPEYQERYEKPFIDAYQTGRDKTARLRLTAEDGTVRQATVEDFDRIVRIPDDDQAADLAAQLFGTKASMVMYHRERVQELNAARYRATEEFRRTGSERFKKASEEATARQTKMRELWEQENKTAQEKYPQWFKPWGDDEEGDKLLAQGYHLADLAFSDQLAQEPVEKQIAVHTALRNRAAAFGRLAHLNRRLTEKVAHLEEELAQYNNSEPSEGEPETPGRGPAKTDDWESQLTAMAQ